MPDFVNFVGFLTAATLIELTPGPNMTYITLISATEGKRAGLSTVAGVTVGLAIIGTLAALGVTTLILSSSILYDMLKWAGVIYFIWLAWLTLTEKYAPQTIQTLNKPSNLKHFKRGLITNILNPKAASFFVAVLPGFLSPGNTIFIQTGILTFCYVLIATVVHICLVLFAHRLSGFLGEQSRRVFVQRVFAAILLALAIWFAVKL